MSCKNCTKRHTACHNTCLDYLEYKMDRLGTAIARSEAAEFYRAKDKSERNRKTIWSTHKYRRIRIDE